jgi:hypothetical protein
MVAPIAKWVNRTGHRFTSSTDVLSVNVAAWTNLTATGSGGEGGIASVTFTVNGVAMTPITARTRRRPNYATTNSPWTGTSEMRDIEAFGFDLDAGSQPNGTITIDAVVTTAAGSTENLPTLKVYNNKDSDTRPGSKVIYVDPVAGDNGNDGLTRGTAVLSIQWAFVLAATSYDLGGATIVLMPGTHDWARYAFGLRDDGGLFTSDHWWVTMRVEDGAVIERNGTMSSNGDVSWGQGYDTLYARPDTGAGQEDKLRILAILEGDGSYAQVTKGDLRVQTNAGTEFVGHVEGGAIGSPAYEAGVVDYSVRFAEHRPYGFHHIAGGGAGTGSHEFTNVTCLGVNIGFSAATYVVDCKVKNYTGIAFPIGSRAPSFLVANVLVDGCRYHEEVLGNVTCRIDSGMALEVVDANTLRLRQAASYDVHPLSNFGNADESKQLALATHAEELRLSERWGIALLDGPKGSGSVVFEALEVTAHGADGGDYTVTLSAPSHGVSAIADLSTHYLYTAQTIALTIGTGSAYVDIVHPDVMQATGDMDHFLWQNVRIQDIVGSRIWASSGSNVWHRGVFVNCGDGATSEATALAPVGAGAMEDMLFFYCTFGSSVDFGSITATGVTEVRRCVFDNLSNAPSGVTFDGNHFVDGADAVGTNAGTGSWFDSDPTADPWALAPLSAHQGAAGGDAVPFAADYTLADAGGLATEGVWRDIAEESYQVAGGGGGGGGGGEPAPGNRLHNYNASLYATGLSGIGARVAR